ncbi:FAD/NAD(P)-binding domain-containing protein [Thozetella sp. PMI_491]|nr:FAD/NAD(P)-binding domain-containing protein [Thozetella sp. PMI_491]
MNETQVIIVGAGPSGLVLGLALAQFRVHSVVLEKDLEVTADPRGVYLTGDAIRILHSLGLGSELPNIGHEAKEVNFHQTSFSSKPFHILRLGASNSMQQAVPEGMLQSQPKLEYALRREIERSEYCTLRTGCRVLSQSGEDPPSIEFLDEAGARNQLKGHWLIGADGKVGVVRKHFLEPTAGIKQEIGRYEYDGTWVAANLKISLPTPETHPQFPLWSLGFSPEDVYDLFWPKGWHFCCPPGKPTATGRFGPIEERLWRHEFRQDNWNDEMDAEALLWEHITPMITLDHGNGRRFPGPVQFPVDCVQVLRCRPFNFTHKVVNRWFHKRTVLIGDAAHVFPPFAGQGIASGVRDAHQLAWRLALLLQSDGSKEAQSALSDNILTAWALERRKSVDDAAHFSKLNGWMCNDYPPFWFRLILWGGFFLPEHHGGARMAQIHVQSPFINTPILSDRLLKRPTGIFALLVLGPPGEYAKLYEDARVAVAAASISPDVMSEKSIFGYIPSNGKRADNYSQNGIEAFTAAGALELQAGHVPSAYVDRLGSETRFAIVRPDFFVFACAKDKINLAKCLGLLQEYLKTGVRPGY